MGTDVNFTDSSIQLKEDEKMGIDVNFTDSSTQLKKMEQCLNFSIIYLPPSEEHCPYTWDGLLCWPNTAPGTIAYLPCLADFNGVKYDTSQFASRLCYANGTWANYTDYNLCSELPIPGERVLATQEDIIIQTMIYLTGYGLSLAALCIAVWIFLYYKDLRCLRNTIHSNLMCTYILADFMWILNFILQMYLPTDVAACVILFILLHYLLLTTYFWMFVEGLYLYMLVVETFTRENIKLRAYIAVGWGTPLIIIIVWGLVRAFTPTDEYDHGSIVDNKLCSWITFNPSDWILNASSIIVLAVNVIFLVMIMWVLITKLRSSNNVETQQYRKATKALLVLIPLLGITYILLITGPREGIYAYIRAFLLSTQGLMVALFYCFLNSEVQNTVRHHITRWKESRNLGARRYTCSKDWSPNTRTESVRLCSKHDVMPYNKRESTASENTTMTIVGGSTNNTRLSNGSTENTVM